MTEQELAQAAHDDQIMRELAGVVGEAMLAAAAREGGFDLGTIVEGFSQLMGAAYKVACLGGEDGKIAYVDFLRRHADVVEATL